MTDDALDNGLRAQTRLREITRRHFFQQSGFGIGALALTSLLDNRLFASTGSLASAGTTIGPHFAPRAKRIIYLFMAGAPSQLDLFDPKPKLNQYDGQAIPEDIVKGERFAFIKGTPKLLGSPFQFTRHGQSGAELSDLLPHLSKHVDDLAIIRSMKTTQFNHAPAQIFMNTGHQVIGRPSLGATQVKGSSTTPGELRVGVLVPVAGTWRLFLQTRANGRVLTVPFTLEVK